jgi:glucose-6-phosphate 1-dehydrogenase
VARNELVIRIQPSEAIYMKFNTKTPGLITRAIPTELDLTYKQRFSEAKIPEAYEALILDAFKGDHSNFVRDDELDVAWKVSGERQVPCETDGRVIDGDCVTMGTDLYSDLALDRWETG